MKPITLPLDAENEVRAYLFLRFSRTLTLLNVVSWLILWRTENLWLSEFTWTNYLGVVAFGYLAWKRTRLPFLSQSARKLIVLNTVFVLAINLLIIDVSPSRTTLVLLTLITLAAFGYHRVRRRSHLLASYFTTPLRSNGRGRL